MKMVFSLINLKDLLGYNFISDSDSDAVMLVYSHLCVTFAIFLHDTQEKCCKNISVCMI